MMTTTTDQSRDEASGVPYDYIIAGKQQKPSAVSDVDVIADHS